MKLKLKKGTTSKLMRIFVPDTSSSVQAGLTALAYNSGSLTWYYIREGASSATSVTLATMTVGTWASGGFKEVDATNLPGIYEIGVPDAALASGANSVVMMLKGATNMAPVRIEIELDAVDYQTATNFGLSALPTASPNASGGLLTYGSSTGQLNPSSGTFSVTVSGYAGGQDPATLVLDTATSGHSTAGTVGKAIADAGSAGDPWSTAIPGSYGTGTAGYIVGNRVDTTISSRLASGNVTVGGYATNYSPADLVLSTAANKLVTDSSGRVQVQPGTSAGQVDLAAGKVKLDFTQAVPTSNTAETVGDALNAARAQAFGKWVLSGTTLRLYASDGSTVVRTFTLDSATAPTQRV